MCEQSKELDEAIAHYQRWADELTDKQMLDRLKELISELEAQKAALRRE
jgi:hypothetical protein